MTCLNSLPQLPCLIARAWVPEYNLAMAMSLLILIVVFILFFGGKKSPDKPDQHGNDRKSSDYPNDEHYV